MKGKNVAILLSGGLDSAITAAYLKSHGYAVKAGVFVNRGQSNYDKEFVAARSVSEYLQIPLLRADFSLADLGKLLSKEMRKKLGIPARNLILGAVALPYAYVLDCGILALGNIISDEFPDCNKEFRSKLTAAASQALDKQIEIVAPFADWKSWNKADEIDFAWRSGYAHLFNITWTCWLGREFHCGLCDACEGRKEGFEKVGLTDPIIYEKSGG